MDATPATSATAGVAILLAEHWDALDADFRHHFGLDLEACCWGSDALGVRRLKAYIARLPQASSAIAHEMGWQWDEMREMTATLIELAANERRQKNTDPVFRWPRPSELLAGMDQDQEPPPLTRQGMRAALMGGGV